MSKSRWGGFRVGKRVLYNWEVRKSPSAGVTQPPVSTKTFDYTTAQGIWNLKSTVEFFKRSSPTTIDFISSSVSSTSTIAFPAGTIVGDLVVLVEFSTTVSASTPSGWTNVVQSSTTGMLASCSYVIVRQNNLLSSVTGLGGTTTKIMMAFRTNSPIKNVIAGSINGQATTAAPSNQTLNMSGVETPVIGIVNYSYTGTAGSRGSSGLTMTEISGSNINSRYVIFNQGATPTNGTISMADAGTNALQSFYLQVA
jgi:hypothetical protein